MSHEPNPYPPTSRRIFLFGTGAAAGALALPTQSAPAGASTPTACERVEEALPVRWQGDYLPVVTPNSSALPFAIVDGRKVFHLRVEEVEHEFAPGLSAHCFGYNGRVHGPTIEAVEGDRVCIYVTNRLNVATTVHWHGLLVPNGMDGVGGLTQRPILPGETFRYEFELIQHGTYMYHSHHDEMTQMALGLMGLFVIHPRRPSGPPVERDYAYLLSEWKLEPGTRRPDPNEMTDFNLLTLNAKIAPATQPLVAQRGERVRIRIGNLSAMDHHPIHLHGHAFQVTETDGGVIPPAGRWPEVSVLVPVGSTRTIEFIAERSGDWALHCHMTHHVMTQMGHGVPNLIGVDHSELDARIEQVVPQFASMGQVRAGQPAQKGSADGTIPANSLPMIGTKGPFGLITMSGMFSLLQVREKLLDDGTAAPYEHPPGTIAREATDEELGRDGIV